ncbi:MAG TPA: hypothetical protein GXZ95_02810 [Mollicutes bacterium]|nr:hypothetical protein [Mollicutes bacterium]
MRFNELQKYLLKVYAITIIALTVIVPTHSSTGTTSYNFVFINNVANVNIGFILIEYLALTLALVASLFAASDRKNKK